MHVIFTIVKDIKQEEVTNRQGKSKRSGHSFTLLYIPITYKRLTYFNFL